ncbi:hypothetical protein [Pandoraea oxalativorans]|nr:hypothetical protein [Pandoraea oxalativorans]
MTDNPMFALQDVALAGQGRTLRAPLARALAAGQVHGPIGHNGSGKSSPIKWLARRHAGHVGFLRGRQALGLCGRAGRCGAARSRRRKARACARNR